MTADRHDLERFHEAQRGWHELALGELRTGRKLGHWMWFVFPQIAGLGFSPRARYYAIRSLEEAQAYLEDDILGPRLRECVAILLDHDTVSAEAVFGKLDAMKLRSSLTLFARAGRDPSFDALIEHWFEGSPDHLTLAIIAKARQRP